MKRVLCTGIFLLLTAVASFSQLSDWYRESTQNSAPPLAATESEKKVLNVMDRILAADSNYENIPPQYGRLLRTLAEATGAKNVVEIGTSTGYSGLWLCLGLARTGGHLTTFETDAKRAAAARGRFKEAGVEPLVTLIEGDAHRQLARITEPIDIVFLNADKEGYVDYLTQLLPRLRPGGLIVAYNIDMAHAYVAAATARPDLETTLYAEGSGLSITLKKR